MKRTLALLLLLAPAASYSYNPFEPDPHGPLGFDPYKLHEETMQNAAAQRTLETMRVEPNQPEAYEVLLPNSRLTCFSFPNNRISVCH
jgi:hypothetical protein